MTIRKPLVEWSEQLADMLAALPNDDIETVLLPPDDPHLRLALEAWQESAQRSQRRPCRHWQKCQKWHALARRQLSARFNVQVPSMPECVRKIMNENVWLKVFLHLKQLAATSQATAA